MDIKFKDNNKLKLGSFTQLEYIESTGTQYIDTGIKPVANDEFEVTYMITGTTGAYNSVFGTRVSVTSNAFMFGYTSRSSYIELGNQNISSFNKGYSQNVKHTIKLENGNLYVDNVLDRSITINQNTVHNLLLFTLNSNGTPSEFSKCKIYNFTIKRAGVKVLELVPVINDNVLCLYDTVSETFFYNQGTGNFIGGPIVNKCLPETIILKTTTLYHKNTPNVNGLQLINYILNVQKTHQDEIKEYYYPTTQLWQDIITEYPDILYWYNINHKFCVYICDANDPEQCAEDFLSTIDDIQQELEDYPDLIPIIAENPTIASIIVEWNPIIHSLINTGYENALIGDGNSWIDTSDMINNNINYEIKFNADNYSNTGEIFGNGIDGDGSSYALISVLDNNKYSIIFKYSEYNNNNYISNNGNHIFEIRTSNGFGKVIFDSNILATSVSIPSQSYNSYLFGVKESASNPAHPFAGRIFYYKTTNNNNNIIKYLTPFYRNGHYGMIDLITFTFYPNAGSGEFTYSLEPKNT